MVLHVGTLYVLLSKEFCFLDFYTVILFLLSFLILFYSQITLVETAVYCRALKGLNKDDSLGGMYYLTACVFNLYRRLCLVPLRHHFLCPRAVPASRNEYQSIRLQLESETLPSETPGGPPRLFHQFSPADQAAMEKRRVAGYTNSRGTHT